MRDTLHLYAEKPDHMRCAAAFLRDGGLVAFATETVYGLGANAFSADAVAGIFTAKERPAWDPLIVHLPSTDWMGEVVEVAEAYRTRVDQLMEAFWPGPLTLLLPRTARITDAVTAGRSLVGLRIPSHPAARELLQEAGLPVAAPSANRFGHVSPTTAAHVFDDLTGRIDAVLDAGPCTVGVESTVLDPTATPMMVYRAGGVTLAALRAACPGVPVELYEEPELAYTPEALPSPGVGLRHYAPVVRLELVKGSPQALWGEVDKVRQRKQRAGFLLPEDWPAEDLKPGEVTVPWGWWADPASLASKLFAALRSLERAGVDVILAPLPEPGGVRDAVRDRLLKAARSA